MSIVIAYVLPMKFLGFHFTDIVSGTAVYRWQERETGRIVMAEGPFSWFRVQIGGAS